MELATKPKEDDFKRLWGIDFKYLYDYLDIRFSNYYKKPTYKTLPQEIIDEFNENEYVGDLISFIFDANLQYGDLGKLNSYGIVHRPLDEYLVIVDYGYNDNVYNTYYS
jgi:hypothetical protein